MLNTSYQIRFSDSFVKDYNYQVFEVNDDILTTLLEKGTIQIKGISLNEIIFDSFVLATSKTEDAILTTTKKTYKLQRRLYSNSFLFATKEVTTSKGDEQLFVHSKISTSLINKW